jgi:hypothetical protein
VWNRQISGLFVLVSASAVLGDLVSAMIPVLAGVSITATNEPAELRTAAHAATTSVPPA